MPPLLYWALEYIQQTNISGGFTIVTKTDVACHQWLRHTLIPPQKHGKPVFRRGLLIMYDARFCFVAFEDLEQNEPGDTLTHTFTWLGWEHCQTRYFYFWATNAGEKMNSTSPIFSKHYTYIPEPITKKFFSDFHTGATTVDGLVMRHNRNQTWAEIHDSEATWIRPSDGSSYTKIMCGTQDHKWRQLSRSIHTLDTTIIPVGATILEASFYIVPYSWLNDAGWAMSLAVFTSAPAVDNNLQASDYLSLGATPLSQIITIAEFAASPAHYFIFTQAGLDAINPGGITRLGIREATYDAPDTPPSWQSGARGEMAFHTVESSAGRRPFLTVKYLEP